MATVRRLDLQHLLVRFRDFQEMDTKRAAMAAAVPIRDAQRRYAPGSGAMFAQTIDIEVVEERADQTVLSVGTSHIGAFVHEYGATIVPVTAKVLHFEIDGEDVFTTRAVIPARPYIRPGFDEAQGEAKAALIADLQAQIQEKARHG